MKGLLHDSEQIALDAERMRAHLSFLACRDMANCAVKHALDLERENPKLAIYFDGLARDLRSKEREAAAAAGIDAD